jgi:sugar phosphate isomerase/epimerase
MVVPRRSFLRNSVAAAVGAGSLLLSQKLRGSAREPHLRFPTVPRERLAVTTWPFRMYMESATNRSRDPKLPGMSLEAFPAMVASKFGLHNVELLSDHFPSTSPAYLRQLREAVRKAGSHIVDLAVGGRASFYDPSAERRQEAIAYGMKWIDIAVAVGSPSVRLHIAGAKGVAPDPGRTSESLTQVAAHGERNNVIVNLENDDLITEDAFFIVRVIDDVGSPYLHALPDFANSMLTGNAAFNYDAMAVMFRHAYNISHMKDSEVGSHDKLYTVDVGRIFKIAERAGYRGYYSLEWEGRGGAYEGVQRLLEESLHDLG